MLGMAVAASAFAACNKQETTPQVENQLGNKKIVMNFANLGTTKSAGTQLDEDQVALKNFQVFFSDGKFLYTPKTATAEEFTDKSANPWGTYFVATEGSEQEFPFLDNAVSQVIVLGNLEAPIAPTEYTTKQALIDAFKTKAIASQQTAANLALYGVDYTLVQTDPHDTKDEGYTEDQHPTPVLKAEVELTPIVARFEVTGMKYSENPNAKEATETAPAVPARAYDLIKVENLSVPNYYTSATVALEAETVVKAAISGEDANFGKTWNADNIYQEYFNNAETVKTGWFWDTIGANLDATTSYVYPVVAEDATNTACHYYHIFADPAKVNPTAVPTFHVQLTAEKTNKAGHKPPSLLYLQTKRIMNGTKALAPEKIEAGKIYRMEFDFNDTVLQEAEKCIDVVVTVVDWEVVPVTPVFK